jgi:trk system potassium uptake protein TrkA
MYIIVVGGGKVGYYLAKELVAEEHEVLVIEQNGSRCSMIAEELGDIVMQGDGCEVATLEKAGMARADIMTAVTGDDEDNLAACQVAKHRFSVPRTVARINNPKNELIFKKLGIDTTVSATAIILAHIEQELPMHPLIPLMTLKGSGLEMVEVKVPSDADVVGKSIKEILLPHQSLITLVVGADGNPRLPAGDTVIQAGDEVVAVTMMESEQVLRAALTEPSGAVPEESP